MTTLTTSSAPTLLGKLRALEERIHADDGSGEWSHDDDDDCREAIYALADLLPAVIAELERQSAGNARYEYLRSMTPRQYSEFHAEWMRSGIRFDDYVDALVAERRAIVANAIKDRT